jgi:hypothetical protein
MCKDSIIVAKECFIFMDSIVFCPLFEVHAPFVSRKGMHTLVL